MTKYSSTADSIKLSPSSSQNEADFPSQIKPKRKSPRRALELRSKIKELSLKGYTPIEIANETGLTRNAVWIHRKNLVADGELTPDQARYQKAGPMEERKWYKIIETTLAELPFYEAQNLVPTARKMGYRLIELAQSAKDARKSEAELENLGLPVLPDIHDRDYHKKKQAFLNRFYRISAEARRGVDSTYTKLSPYPKIPLECFKDDLRDTIGWTDRDTPPYEPTPARGPYPWDDYQKDRHEEAEEIIAGLDDIPDDYNGRITPGNRGRRPSWWWKQPIYCRIFCESETIQPDLVKHQGGRHVKVSAMRGQFSTPSMVKFCKEIKHEVESDSSIKKIVILYFGDSDKSGNDIRSTVEKALIFYNGGGIYEDNKGGLYNIPASDDLNIGIEIEVRHVCITPDQVKKYGLKGYQLEAFMTTERRLEIFKRILQDSIDDCHDENLWKQYCPPEEYDYEAHGEEEPEDYDIDVDVPDPEYWNVTPEEQKMESTREIMEHRNHKFKKRLKDEYLV